MKPGGRAKPASPPERLEKRLVRRNERIGADGATTISFGVACQALSRDVDLEVCAACARCRSLPSDPAVAGAEVLCKTDPPAGSGPRLRELDMVEAALRTPLRNVMGTETLSLEVGVTLARAAELARAHGRAALAVVDADARPVGVVTWTELVEHAATGPASRSRTVGELCRPLGSVYASDAPLLHALPAVADGAVGYAIVVEGDGAFHGLLTAVDVARWMARRAGYEL